MEHSTDNLNQLSANEQAPVEEKKYTPRPKGQLILAWVMIAVVLFAFLGTCYWMVFYGKV